MDPFTLSLITGIISTCLYSSVLRIADEAVDIPLNEKNIIDRLMKNEASFASLIEKTFQNISPAVKKEIFYEFLKSDEGIEIVKRIYSYDLSDEGELNNLEKIKDDFCKRVILYFENSKEMSTAAPNLFFLLVKCCQESLQEIIKEEGFLAFDYRIRGYFNILNERFDKYQNRLIDEITTNNKLITRVLDNTDKIANILSNGRYEAFRNAYISPNEVFGRVDLEHFIGREWLLAKVDSFLLRNDRGYFIFEAEAGLGKTAFLAWLVWKRDYIHNFCELTQGPEKMGDALKNLSSQLALFYKLSTEGILPVDAASRPDYLYDMLEKASKKCRDGKKIVLVIDALDEAGTLKYQNVLGLPKSLPKGVFIIASQRPVGVTLSIDTVKTCRDVCRLSDFREENEEDIRRFLHNVITWPKIAALLKEHNYTSDEFVSTLMEKCQGVWIYLHYVIPEIESGARSISDLDSLPEGLLNYYIGYWVRWREKNQWDESYLPLLANLAVAQESISIEQLKVWAASAMSVSELQRLLKMEWRPYIIISLHDDQKKYRFYHQSLKDFFNDQVERKNLSTADESFLEELKEATFKAHENLAERYLIAWGRLEGGLPRLQDNQNLTIDEGYGLHYLVFHLEALDRVKDIHRLLSLETAEQHNAWYEAKEAYGTVADYMVDVARAWQLVEKASESKIKKGEIPSTIKMEILYSLVSASVNSLCVNFPPKLLVVLVKKDIWTLKKGLAYVLQIQRPEKRVEALLSIIHNLSESQLSDSQREVILIKALEAAAQIQIDYEQGETFVKIAPYLPNSMMKETLDAVIQIQNGHYQVKMLASIAPRLPEFLIKDALKIAVNFQDESNRANALIGIASRLPEYLMKEALDVAKQIQDQYYRANVLSKIAFYLPKSEVEGILKEALNAAMQIQNEGFRAKVLVKIASHPSETMVKEAFDAVIQISDQYYRVMALSEIVSSLPASMKKEALREAQNATTQIHDHYYRAMTLFELAFHLSNCKREKARQEALDAAIQIHDEKYRVEMLVKLAPYLSISLKEKLMDSIIQIQDLVKRTESLSKLFPILSLSKKKKVLDEVIQVHNEHFRAQLLTELAPHLPESMKKQASDAAIKIQHGEARAIALCGLAPYLPVSLMKGVLDAAIKIQVSFIRAEALTEIAFYMPEPMETEALKEALNAAKQIPDQRYLVKLLVKIAPYLSESLRKEALKEALKVAVKIPDEYLRFQDGSHRAEALVEIAPKLPESMMNKLLDAATQIQEDFDRAEALIGISSYLPEFLMKETLNAAMQIRLKHVRDDALAKIYLNMHGSMMKEKLDAATQIQDNSDLEKVLTRKAFHLSESMAKEALDAAMQIQDDSDQAESLAKILSSYVNVFSLDQLYAIWTKVLHRSIISRRELYINLGEMMPVIYKLGEEKALNETFYAIRDGTRWWT
jgi:hypothetical protein